MKKTYLWALLLLLLVRCYDGDEYRLMSATDNLTIESEAIYTNTNSAIIKLDFDELEWDYYLGDSYGHYSGTCRIGIMLGKERNNMTVATIQECEDGWGRRYYSLNGLDDETTYYYRPFVEDKFGERVFGTVDSFETGIREWCTTGSYTQTSAQYKYYGFRGSNGYYYDYSYNFNVSVTLNYSSPYIDSWGYVWFGDCEPITSDGTAGTKTGSCGLLTDSSSGTKAYGSYVKFADGTYYYGEEKTLNFNY